MIYNTNHYTVAELLRTGEGTTYSIPKYQREYIWAKENWEAMFDDIVDAGEAGSFIGSILCVRGETPSGNDTVMLELIDGQQRLATISLMLLVARDLLGTRKGEGASEDAVKSIASRLVGADGRERTILSEQHGNRADYRALLAESGLLQASKDDGKRKNRRIYRAYRYFAKRMEEYDTAALLRMLALIDRMLVVKIEVGSHADAYMLFEGLNDRGVPLSAADLIKNKMLSGLERKGISIEDAFRGWNAFLENIVEHTVQERFLKHYYDAFHIRNEVKVGNIGKATKANLVRIYETLIERDPGFIFAEIVEKSEIYHAFMKGSGPAPIGELARELDALAEAKAAPAYMLLMYLFSTGMRDIDFYREVIGALTRYFAKRALYDNQEDKDVDQYLMDLILQIEHDRTNRLTAEYIGGYLTHTIYLR